MTNSNLSIDRSVTLAVTVSPHRVRSGDLEHCIEETLRAMFGVNSTVSVLQTDDTSLQITVTPSTRYQLSFR